MNKKHKWLMIFVLIFLLLQLCNSSYVNTFSDEPETGNAIFNYVSSDSILFFNRV